MISVIVAIAKNGVIGGDNTLLWHISEDLKNFKRLTMGSPIVMGRKTYDSIGRPLPGRDNIVISRQQSEIEGCRVVHSLQEAIELYPLDREIFVIGGGEIYTQAIPLADRLYLTRVHHEYSGDTYMPEIDIKRWHLVTSVRHEGCEGYDYPFSFEEYRRCAVPSLNYYIGRTKTNDIELIRDIALVSFVETYREFISQEQIDYMLDWMYSKESLQRQMEDGYRYYILYHECSAVGYIALRPKPNNVIYLERLYLLAAMHGQGLGRLMMSFIYNEARMLNGNKGCRIELNVNRNNRAVGYYSRLGFEVAQQGDYQIEGTNFTRNDYIMAKEIQ